VKSIRTRLLAWLLSAVFLGALLGATATYLNVREELEAQFDYQLRQMALSLRDQGYVSPEDAAAIADERRDFVVQIWTMDGLRIYASSAAAGFPARATLGFSDVDAAGTAWRVFSVAARDRVIQVGQPIEVRRDLAARAALRSVLPILALAPLLAALAWWTVGASLAPLRRVVEEVRRRDSRALEPLAAHGTPQEIAPLTSAIDALLASLRSALAAQRAFVADAAHELRSPLTALRLQLGLLERAPDETARRAALQALSAGIERASRLVQQLLTLARSDPDGAPAASAPVDLAETARLAAADVVELAAARGTELSLRAPTAVNVRADAAALRILVRNLADNAVRYTPPGGRVELGVRAQGGSAELTCDDSGPGIPAAERERVFDRFYRRAAASEEESGGSGLGLAIVRAIAERHGARVTLEDSPIGGLRVRVVMGSA
jgi:two-component system OmpR family sensor kinase/two-component system sensor histidine kinase QseC